MKRWLFIWLIGLPVAGRAQSDQAALQQTDYFLRVNAKYPLPAQWQGSDREHRALDLATAQGKDPAGNTRENGVGSLKHGDYDRAVAYYERACQLDPHYHGYTGWVYLDYMRDYDRALHHLNAYDSLTASPDDMIGDNSVQFLKGRVYSQTGQYQKAIDHYSMAISTIEQRVGAEWVSYLYYIARGVAHRNNNQPALALADFEKALKNNAESAMAHYHRGTALQQLGRLSEAAKAYQDAQFFLKAKPVERDVYFEHFDAVYDQLIEAALKIVK